MTDREAIDDLLERYHVGLHRGDLSILETVFLPTATYVTASGGELLHLTMAEYFPIVAERTSPLDRGEPLEYGVDEVQFAGPTTALARVHSTMLGRRFVDYLSLLKVDGQWRVAAKVFHYDELDD